MEPERVAASLAEPAFVTREEVFAARPERAAGQKFTGLWVAGSLAGLQRPTVAIVGTRAPSEAGRSRAHELAATLARAGICVVSGLALGIDGAAHAGALAAGGPTLGILGGGHRHFFPQLPRRTHPGTEGFDAFGIVLVNFLNDGSRVSIVDDPEEFDLKGLDYAQMVHRVSSLYATNFSRI